MKVKSCILHYFLDFNNSRKVFETGSTDTLWCGRPDILLIRTKADPIGSEKLNGVLVGEVKYTEDQQYAKQGLKELMEYMALLKRNNGYVEDQEEVLKSGEIQGSTFLGSGRDNRGKGVG